MFSPLARRKICMIKPHQSLLPILACCVALLGLGSSRAEAKVRKGDRPSKFVSVKNGAGKKVQLKSYKDRIVVLTFGASWCKPCKKELPAFEKLARKYDTKKVIFLAVNVDSDSSKGKAFMKKAGLKQVYALYDPKSSTVESFDPPTMPSTFIIKRGIVKHVHAGYRSGDAQKVAKIIDAELR